MLFLRSQEHYESPFPEIKDNHFDIMKFMDIYRKWRGVEYFSYPNDWSGFNVPGQIVEFCTNHVLDVRNGIFPTEYDYIMDSITKSIRQQIGHQRKYYLIGTDTFESRTMKHELAHGLYYVDEKYRRSVHDLILDLPSKTLVEMESILLKMGYCKDVILDEIQAYMSTGITSSMSKIKGIKKSAKLFEKNLKKHRG
jgi:hypothetical protein